MNYNPTGTANETKLFVARFCCSVTNNETIIAHFTVVCLVTWPWIGSEAGSDFDLIQTSLLFICR